MRTVADVKAILSLSCTQIPQIRILTGHISMYLFSQWNKIKEKMFKFITGCIFGDQPENDANIKSNNWLNLSSSGLFFH